MEPKARKWIVNRIFLGWEKDDVVHDVVDEWVVSFVYGHSTHFAPSRKRLLRHCEISQSAHKNENRQKGQITSGKENGGVARWKKWKWECKREGGEVKVSQARRMQSAGSGKRCIWRWLQSRGICIRRSEAKVLKSIFKLKNNQRNTGKRLLMRK